MDTANQTVEALLSELSPRKAKFAVEYVKDMDGTRAAIAAGYSTHTATEQASRLLNSPLLANVKVQNAITALIRKHADDTGVTVDYVLRNLMEVVERGLGRKPMMGDLLKDGTLQKNEANQIKFEFLEGITQNTRTYAPASVNRALQLLGLYRKMWSDPNLGGETDIADKLRLARERTAHAQ